jgi:hypothetical protein
VKVGSVRRCSYYFEPDVVPVAEPDVVPVAEPDVEPVAEPDVEPVAEPLVDPVVLPEPLTEPVVSFLSCCPGA